MKIPYGLSNFKDILTEGYLYIDKTRYIEKLEQQGKYNILLRPRRFGKSLFLSSLWHYYDIRFQDEFSDLFGSLYIGGRPTPLKNSYQVLFFDFSGIATHDSATIYRGFCNKVEKGLLAFLEQYKYQPEVGKEVMQAESPAAKLDIFTRACVGNKIYLLIDEYDHFANAILGDSLERFKDIVGKGGFVRAFYETIKTATMEGVVDRLFITGVTSITLDSFTSGFNNVDNITHHRDFNQAIGFTRQETETVCQPLITACELDRQKLMAVMAQWYNGYLFSEEREERIYNSDMVLYFVKNFNRETCQYPRRMLDDNIVSDYKKIMQLFAIGDSDANYATLEELITNGEVIGLHKRLIDIDRSFGRDDFISLLLYMGFITMGETVLNEIRYRIPNYVIQKLYYEYFKIEIEQRGQITMDNRRLTEAVRQLALHNNIQPFLAEINKTLALFSNRDFMNMDEKHIKAVILTLLYQSEVYFIQSEPEINNRYPDILLLERNPFKVKYQFLFELKFSKKKDGKKGLTDKKAEGIKQIKEYLCLENIRHLAELQSYLLLTDGSAIEAVAVE